MNEINKEMIQDTLDKLKFIFDETRRKVAEASKGIAENLPWPPERSGLEVVGDDFDTSKCEMQRVRTPTRTFDIDMISMDMEKHFIEPLTEMVNAIVVRDADYITKPQLYIKQEAFMMELMVYASAYKKKS